ncbi:hypothetical protein F5Y05DRAFT_410091 [Hypoxylon sp. FL0543]|nr:hypothetical protein F5Y05DRAFT_410091 [Hypoxylon sp. FL0543]
MARGPKACSGPIKKIEEYRGGYPRFCALIAANADFFICRRFLRLRSRLLLLKQDRIAQLEQSLDDLDQNETAPLSLGESRSDRNTARTSLLTELSSDLADYDLFVERTCKILSLRHALPRDVSSLEKWLRAKGCISRSERKFLENKLELASLASSNDSALKQLEDWVEDILIDHYKGFRALPQHDLSTDPDMYIYSGPLVKSTARALMLVLITALLLTPVVVCILVNSVWAQICVIIVSTVAYLSVLSKLTNSRMMELILAGAT